MPIPQVTDRIKEAPAVVLRAVFAGIGQLLMAVDKIRAQSQEQHTSPAPAGRNGTGPAQPANGASNVTQLRERTTAAARPAAAQTDTAPAPPAAAKRATAPKSTAKPAAATKAATTPKPAPGPKPAATAKPTGTAKPAGIAKPAAAPKPAAPPKPAAGPKPATAAKPTAAKRTAAEPAAVKPAAKPAAVKPAAAPEPAAAQPASAAAPAAPPIPGYDDLSVASLRARLRGLDADGVQALLAYEKTHARRDDVITMFERRLSKIEDEAR
jgi:hypothetical protein